MATELIFLAVYVVHSIAATNVELEEATLDYIYSSLGHGRAEREKER